MDAWNRELLGLSMTGVYVMNLVAWAIFAAIKALRLHAHPSPPNTPRM